jgi:hypothetical protein
MVQYWGNNFDIRNIKSDRNLVIRLSLDVKQKRWPQIQLELSSTALSTLSSLCFGGARAKFPPRRWRWQFQHSKSSLIRIGKMKNSVHSWVHSLEGTWDFGARELSDCVQGSWRDWNHARKRPRLVSAGWKRPWISASDKGTNYYSDIFYLLNFQFICFLSFFLSFKPTLRFSNPD